MKILKGIGYWFIQYTWGIIMTLIGSFVALGMLITGHKPYRFHYNIYFIMKSIHDCGTEFGPFFILSADCANDLYLKQHEAGHGLQNLWWGPLTAFVISIPSAFRFWLREIKDIKNKYIYSFLVTGIVILIGLTFVLLDIFLFKTLIILIIAALLSIYGCILLQWSTETEVPLYDPRLVSSPPGYYDIWFEKQASNLGKKYFN